MEITNIPKLPKNVNAACELDTGELIQLLFYLPRYYGRVGKKIYLGKQYKEAIVELPIQETILQLLILDNYKIIEI